MLYIPIFILFNIFIFQVFNLHYFLNYIQTEGNCVYNLKLYIFSKAILKKMFVYCHLTDLPKMATTQKILSSEEEFFFFFFLHTR